MEELLRKIEKLDEGAKKIFDRIYEVRIEEAQQYFPNNLKEKFKEAENQRIIIFKNKILNQETHFNIWRAKRKEPKKEEKEGYKYDPFCNPLEETPYDDLGRLENEKAITASNLAKISRDHSLIIFKEHNKENISKEDIRKALEISIEWFGRKNGRVNILIWNLGFRSGASIEHPHFQIFSFDYLPAKIEYFYKKILEYEENFKTVYFEDLYKLYDLLGLSYKLNNLKIFINLTPFKDNELIFIFEDLKNSLDEVSNLLSAYKEEVENFNLLLCESASIKIGFLVDRGESSKINSDIGALEIYAFSVVGFDPLEFSKTLFPKLH